MASLYLDELTAAASSSTFNLLSNDSSDSKSSASNIEGFISGSGSILQGEQWDKVRSKMGVYQSALAARANCANNLGKAINDALKLLTDYMGDDAMLDTAQLPEFTAERNACIEQIATLKSMMNEMETVNWYENGRWYSTTRHKYDVAAIQGYINNAEAVLKELNRIIKKLEGLDEIYAQAEAMLEAAYQDVLAFQQMVSSITPSGKYVYQSA